MDNKELGRRCKLYRRYKLKATQNDVARDTGYSKNNISAFETGRNNNANILLWYIERGFVYRAVNNK